MLRSSAHGKPGRSAYGTSHAVLRAFCIAVATPRAPRNVPTRPTTRASPDWCSGPLGLSCWPITGYCDNAEFSSRCCSPGSFLSTMLSTVTSTSSSGKIAMKA
jgi:hypothetical protein